MTPEPLIARGDPDAVTFAVETRRRSTRVPVSVPLRARIGINRHTVVLTDLTPHGARIEGLDKQQLGTAVTLLLPGLKPKTAQVAWSEGGASGVEFDQPLHTRVFEGLISTYAIERHRRVALGRLAPEPVRDAA